MEKPHLWLLLTAIGENAVILYSNTKLEKKEKGGE
jgi:hypothetical protein